MSLHEPALESLEIEVQGSRKDAKDSKARKAQQYLDVLERFLGSILADFYVIYVCSADLC